MNVKRIKGENLWKRGQPLTKKDEELLQIVKDLAVKLGHTPIKRECKESAKLKARFRTWRDVIYASGLPALKSREEMVKRKAKRN